MNRLNNTVLKDRVMKIIVCALIAASFLFIPCSPGRMTARAAGVQYKSKYYITMKVSKNVLKKGQKAKVTVTVKNTSGNTMKSVKLKASLPSYLQKASGKLNKSKSSLAKNKTYSYSFRIKAKKNISFKKTVASSKSVSGLTTKVVSKGLFKGVKKKWLKVTMTYTKPAAPVIKPDNYANSMIDLLVDMSAYAKKNSPGFAMITNGGYGLYMSEFNKDAERRKKLFAAMDGVLIEDVFYGWDNRMNKSMTSDSESRTTSANMQLALKEAKAGGLTPLNIEYCNSASCIEDSNRKSAAIGSVWYNAPSFDLNTLPALAQNRINRNSVTSLSQVRNFAAMLDPENYDTKAKYLNALKNSDYDLIFIDAFYDDELLSKADVNYLKTKKDNKTRRMVCAYVSVGEAEKYRYYWNSDWNKKLPVWIDSENEDWEGNYKVKYWSRDWKDILYGTPSSYLGKVLSCGYNGAYLDVIDAYEYFRKKK